MARVHVAALAALAAAALFGCRDEQAGPKRRTLAPGPAAIRTLDRAPDGLTFRSDAVFGGAIRYLGARVTPANPAPGSTVRVAQYFQFLSPPPPGFAFFVHAVDPRSGQMLLNLDHPLQGSPLPLEQFPVGKVIEDVHPLPLPAGGGQVQLRLGFWRDQERLAIEPPAAADGEGRALGPTVSSGVVALPTYSVTRTDHPPKIDGKLDDPAWQRAAPVTLVDSLDGHPVARKTVARMLYDDQALYLSFDCEDPDVWGTLLKRDEPIYSEEVVELFVDADGDGRTYDEMEVSPRNTVFDAWFPARREGMDTSHDAGMTTAVTVQGTLDDRSDRDQGWKAELRIPFARLHAVPRLPPRPGDRWRFNLYRLDFEGGYARGQAFSPVGEPDFHALPKFGWLQFEGT